MTANAVPGRILIWSASYAPVEGGLQTVVKELANGLSKKGHKVSVLTNRIPISLKAHELTNNITVTRLRFFHIIKPVHSVKDVLGSIYGAILFPVRLFQIIKIIGRFKPDVINIQFPGQQIWFIWILKAIFKNIKWIISLHGDEILKYYAFDSKGNPPQIKAALSFSERIQFLILKRNIIHADELTTCSEYLMTMTKKLFKSAEMTGKVVHNGIDYPLFSTPKSRLIKQEYIFACGRLTYAKGFDLLIKAYALLPESLRLRYKLVIAGSGIEKENLVTEAIKLEIQNRIQFYGSSTQPETASLLQHSVLTVIPSRRETFGLVMLEAMATGVNVLATNVGGIPEIAKFGNIFLSDPDFNAIADKMRDILSGKIHTSNRNDTTLKKLFSRDIMLNSYENILFA
jgi:glycosyltransferase involved in cell wall biosynthesis